MSKKLTAFTLQAEAWGYTNKARRAQAQNILFDFVCVAATLVVG